MRVRRWAVSLARALQLQMVGLASCTAVNKTSSDLSLGRRPNAKPEELLLWIILLIEIFLTVFFETAEIKDCYTELFMGAHDSHDA